jgi:hypothetical protein
MAKKNNFLKGILTGVADFAQTQANEVKLKSQLALNEAEKRKNFIWQLQAKMAEKQQENQMTEDLVKKMREQDEDNLSIDTPQIRAGAGGKADVYYPNARDKEFNIKMNLNRISQKEARGMSLSPQEQTFKENYGGMLGSGKELDRASGLRKEFQEAPVYKNYQTVNSQFNSLKSAYTLSLNPDNESRAASDQALIVTLNKMLDPTSVVRESEFARTEVGVGLMNRIQSYLPKLKKGGQAISNTDRKAIYEMAGKLLQGSQEGLNQHIDRYVNIAKQYGVDPKLILGDIEKFDTSSSQFNAQPTDDLTSKIEQARQSGYSEEEIQSYLKSKGL